MKNLSDDTPSWARQLETMRQRRGQIAMTDNVSFSQDESLSDEQKRHAHQKYLEYWQQEHNAQVEDIYQNVSAQILLSDEWYIESQQILNYQSTTEENVVQLQESSTKNKIEPVSENPPSIEEKNVDSSTKTIFVSVLKPDCNPQKPVAVVDESILLQYLIDKLSPHLLDAVNGAVKVSIQKNLRKISMQIEDELKDQLPEIIEETLNHYLIKMIKRIKTN